MSVLSGYELGWLVGILEGEGHFGLYTSQVIEVNMTDEDTIYKVASLFERVLQSPVNVVELQKARGKNVFCARIYGERARTVMRLVVSHMSSRRRQVIWQCLNGYKAPKVDLVKLLGLNQQPEGTKPNA
jgi:hypothetical protein